MNNLVFLLQLTLWLDHLKEGGWGPGDSTGLKMYVQATKEIDKEYDKLDILILNDKYIIDNFSVYPTNMAGDALH